MKIPVKEKLVYEKAWMDEGKLLIAGTDEVGRGPLAGPVVCAAVIMPLDEDQLIEGVDDSKKVSEKKREMLYDLILQRAIAYKICAIEPEEIDRINIRQAVLKCMKQCVEGLSVKPDGVLVDAMVLDTDIPQRSIIKGDAVSYSIGAASIVAKVWRDRLMNEYDKQYPGYGFAKNKGYGTKVHIDRIREVGPCAIHRKTFIGNFWAQAESEKPKNI